MRRALTLAGTRRAKWLVAAFWLVVLFGLNAVNIFDLYADAEKNRTIDYLPSGAESVEVIDRIDEFPSGERFAAVVVYRRDGGLTAGDRALIARDRKRAGGGRDRGPAAAADLLAGRHHRAQRRCRSRPRARATSSPATSTACGRPWTARRPASRSR